MRAEDRHRPELRQLHQHQPPAGPGCYYFEAVAQLPKADRQGGHQRAVRQLWQPHRGLIAKALGLPVKRFIAATNANDTVPRYLKTGSGSRTRQWQPVERHGCEPPQQLA
jgi:threonine synthase